MGATDVRLAAARAKAENLATSLQAYVRVVVAADALVDGAKLDVERAVRSLYEQAHSVLAAALSVDGLRRFGAPPIVLERLKRAGCVTVADAWSMAQMPGDRSELGRATLEQVGQAVRRFEADATVGFRLYPDPDARRPGDDELLWAAYRYDDLRRNLVPALNDLRAWQVQVQRAETSVLGEAPLWRLFVSGKARRQLVEQADPLLAAIAGRHADLSAAMDRVTGE